MTKNQQLFKLNISKQWLYNSSNSHMNSVNNNTKVIIFIIKTICHFKYVWEIWISRVSECIIIEPNISKLCTTAIKIIPKLSYYFMHKICAWYIEIYHIFQCEWELIVQCRISFFFSLLVICSPDYLQDYHQTSHTRNPRGFIWLLF